MSSIKSLRLWNKFQGKVGTSASSGPRFLSDTNNTLLLLLLSQVKLVRYFSLSYFFLPVSFFFTFFLASPRWNSAEDLEPAFLVGKLCLVEDVEMVANFDKQQERVHNRATNVCDELDRKSRPD